MPLDLKRIKYKDLGFFRFRKLGEKYLLTNDVGDHIFLTENEFQSFLSGKLPKDKEPYLSLAGKNFVRGDTNTTGLMKKYASKKAMLGVGPSLHIIVVTLRCNHRCVYCDASAQAMHRKDVDMDKNTARRVVDMIFQTTSPFVAIEFQGGEPLANWPVVKFIVDCARKKSKQSGKTLELRLVSNMSLMNDERFKYLTDKRVNLCTSFDGPKKLHNRNRPYVGGDSYDAIKKWTEKFFRNRKEFLKDGYIYRMSGLLTVSRFSLPYWREIIDEYVKIGFRDVALRNLSPFGLTKKRWKAIAYSPSDFLDFYEKTISYIIEVNLKGRKFGERIAIQFLQKILTDFDPNYFEFRSPCGAGIGQLAYNYNGDVYSCDEGRMLSMLGDESFLLGNVAKDSYKDIVGNPVVRTLCTASCLDGLAGCSDCAYLPYCGVCPIYNYYEHGNIFSQTANNSRCKMSMGILDILFKKLQEPKSRKVLSSWVR